MDTKTKLLDWGIVGPNSRSFGEKIIEFLLQASLTTENNPALSIYFKEVHTYILDNIPALLSTLLSEYKEKPSYALHNFCKDCLSLATLAKTEIAKNHILENYNLEADITAMTNRVTAMISGHFKNELAFTELLEMNQWMAALKIIEALGIERVHEDFPHRAELLKWSLELAAHIGNTDLFFAYVELIMKLLTCRDNKPYDEAPLIYAIAYFMSNEVATFKLGFNTKGRRNLEIQKDPFLKQQGDEFKKSFAQDIIDQGLNKGLITNYTELLDFFKKNLDQKIATYTRRHVYVDKIQYIYRKQETIN